MVKYILEYSIELYKNEFDYKISKISLDDKSLNSLLIKNIFEKIKEYKNKKITPNDIFQIFIDELKNFIKTYPLTDTENNYYKLLEISLELDIYDNIAKSESKKIENINISRIYNIIAEINKIKKLIEERIYDKLKQKNINILQKFYEDFGSTYLNTIKQRQSIVFNVFTNIQNKKNVINEIKSKIQQKDLKKSTPEQLNERVN